MNFAKRLDASVGVPAAIFTLSLLLNLCARSYFFNFDGVACAVAVELSDWKHLVHGNHLAYGVVAWLFNGAWRLLGYRGEALYPMQVLSGLLGAAAASVFSAPAAPGTPDARGPARRLRARPVPCLVVLEPGGSSLHVGRARNRLGRARGVG
ncbi:MAG: hypothetical protein AAB036_05460 [Elusimicrobiota bacterium]